MNKKCECCNKDLINVNHQTKYCDSCRELSNKQSTQKYKKRARAEISKAKEKELVENFNKIVKEPCHLTPYGFNEVSILSHHPYQNLYRKKWIEILKDYNKYDELLEYIIKEYWSFIDSTGKKNFRTFSDNHKYITEGILKTIGYDNIREMLNLKKNRNTKEDCKKEFMRVFQLFNRVPLYSEFLGNSRINIKSYVYHLEIKEQKNIYDQIVKEFVNESIYNDYLNHKSEHKAKMGRENHQGYKYTIDELVLNLKSVFNEYHKEYDSYPSLHLFDKISKIDSSIYIYRFNKKWAEICKSYGYEIEGKYKSEKIALGIVSEILNSDYEPQKTFDWLIGFKGYPLFCDGYFPQYQLVVEFDGDQHRYPNEWFGGWEVFNNIKTNDKYKDVLIPRNGLKLLRISSEEPYWDKEYVKNKLIKSNIVNTPINKFVSS